MVDTDEANLSRSPLRPRAVITVVSSCTKSSTSSTLIIPLPIILTSTGLVPAEEKIKLAALFFTLIKYLPSLFVIAVVAVPFTITVTAMAGAELFL